MQIIDTFSGIGGFSLAGRWMGWRTVQFCEIDKFCQKVLAYHFPGVPIHNDIKTLTAKQIINNGLYDKNEPTIFVGGVPCQPWSQAGKRLGKEDDRDLWEETISLIGEIQPDFAILENVRGFINWNGGMVFDEVQTDLEAEGYEVLPFLLPACAVNAPHRRDRIWFVAYRSINGHSPCRESGESESNGRKNNSITKKRCEQTERFDRLHALQRTNTHSTSAGTREDIGRIWSKHNGHSEGIQAIEQNDVTNPDSRRQSGKEYGQTESGRITETSVRGNWENFPTEPPICGGDDGLPTKLDGITFPKWRNESIKGYGNAIVPQVAVELFNVINQLWTF